MEGQYPEESSGHQPPHPDYSMTYPAPSYDYSHLLEGVSACPSVGSTTPASTPGPSKPLENRKKKGRGGNDTTRLPRHPDPEVERKREEERIKNKLYQSTSRSIKDAEFKSAQAQIAMVWQFFRDFQHIEKARNAKSMERCHQMIEAERNNSGGDGRETEWREMERQLDEYDHKVVKGTVLELELRMQIEAVKLELEKKEIRRQVEDKKMELMAEKGLE